MTLEETIGAAVDARMSPMLAELRRMTSELEALRRSLPPQLLTMPEAAERLGVSLATVRRRVGDGTLPSRRVGRSVRVDLAALNGVRTTDVDARVLDIRATLASRRERAGGQT